MINNNENNTIANTESKGARIQYGFTLNFPDRFTMKSLSEACDGKVKYITLRSRVQKAIREGLLVEEGLQAGGYNVRGRRQMIYVRVDASKACESIARGMESLEASVVQANAETDGKMNNNGSDAVGKKSIASKSFNRTLGRFVAIFRNKSEPK